MIRWRLYARQDWLLLSTMLVLSGIGIAFIFSATYRGPGFPVPFFWIKQMVWLGAGLLLYAGAIQVDPGDLIRQGPLFYGLGVFLLILVALIGVELNEGKRWLSLGPFLLQPSEFVKIANLLFLVFLLGEVDQRRPDLKRVLVCLGWIAVPLGLVIRQPDLGTALVFLPSCIGVLFLAGIRWKHLLLLFLAGLVVILPVAVQLVHYSRVFYPLLQHDPSLVSPTWYFLKPYQCNRILVFLDPGFDTWGAGWNLMQCKIAVGSGGWSGQGFLNGSQNLLGFLPRPVAPTDFIFSVLAEETGFKGVLALLGLYGLLLTRMVWIGLRCRREPSYGLLAGGVSIIFFCHIFVNLGMTIGLMPITGLPLPLVSYGGSFLLGSMLAIGLVQGIYVRRQP